MSIFISGEVARNVFSLCRLVIFIFFASAMTGAWGANCSGSGQAYTVTLPVNISVPRDAPPGSLILNWTNSVSGGGWFTCYNSGANEFVGGAAAPVNLVASGKTWVSGDQTYTLYNTGVAGVGLAIGFQTVASGNCGAGVWFAVTPGGNGRGWSGPPPAGWSGGGCGSSGSSSTWNAGGQARFALVTTGPVSAGTTLSGQVLKASGYTNWQGILNPQGSYSITPVNIITLSCSTPNVDVPLGIHRVSEFKGSGSTTNAVRFLFSANNCPAGMGKFGPAIQYKVESVTSVLNSSQSVVALDAGSNAKGIGVQLLDGNGSVFPLNTYKTLSGYNSSVGGNYSVTFQARYYQVASTVSPGKANTSMTVTMLYQ
ncbi:fimbrial protein [Pseudomonas nicosulfuronedens]